MRQSAISAHLFPPHFRVAVVLYRLASGTRILLHARFEARRFCAAILEGTMRVVFRAGS